MPIYAYRCATCGHAKDVLQKISDPAADRLPGVRRADVRKQVTAAGFQLKGSGWYVTDFRGDKQPAGKADAGEADGKTRRRRRRRRSRPRRRQRRRRRPGEAAQTSARQGRAGAGRAAPRRRRRGAAPRRPASAT